MQTGIANKSNLKDWAGYAKHPTNFPGDHSDKAPRTSEGRGWAKPRCDLSDNTYTGPGGSKRD
jgi:hypothetical protein